MKLVTRHATRSPMATTNEFRRTLAREESTIVLMSGPATNDTQEAEINGVGIENGNAATEISRRSEQQRRSTDF